ncbi:MAG: hypothetical protein K2O04_03795 [Clostridiales bacterium]|nr:hypothetical protein [Clostridiales bacterium]
MINGESVAQNTALMVQDHFLFQMVCDGYYTESHSVRKLRLAMSDALSELSRSFPVYLKKTFETEDGLIPRLAIAGEGSLTVTAVTADGKPVPYSVDHEGIHLDGGGAYDVVYSPEMFDIEVYSDFDVAPEVGYQMIIHLVARNYCMLSGRMEEAAMYDSRYNDDVEAIRLKRSAHLPPRKFF